MTTLHKSAKRPLPHVIAVSSMGLGQNHRHMPLALRVSPWLSKYSRQILYPWMLSGPHADKEGMEYVLLRASSHFRTPEALPPSSILSDAERNMVPEDFLPRLTIVRPALFTDGEERGSGKLKAGEDLSTYSISRKDVALFISEQCLKEKEGVSWVNRTPVVGY